MNQEVEFEMFEERGSGFKEICTLGEVWVNLAYLKNSSRNRFTGY